MDVDGQEKDKNNSRIRSLISDHFGRLQTVVVVVVVFHVVFNVQKNRVVGNKQ